MAGGIASGLAISALGGPEAGPVQAAVVEALDLAGRIFIRLLKMVIIPLIVATMVTGVLSLEKFRRLFRMGVRTFIYYFATTALSVSLGLLLVNLVQPGAGADIGGGRLIEQLQGELVTWPDLLESMVPDNPVRAMAEMDVLPVIVFSLVFGAALLAVGREAEPLPSVFQALTKVMMKLTHWIILLAPAGVFALMATVVIEFGGESLFYLAKYMATVIAGLAIHFFITLPLIALVLGRYSPFRLLKDVSAAILTAISSASSSATLPLTIDRLQTNTGLSNRTTSFVLPIGATVNMDGTALYEAVAVVFIAQAYGVELGIGKQFLVFVTATLAAIGAAAIPSAGLFTMAIVLNAVGLPLEGVALILGVDRVLDMLRTGTNVWGDCVGSLVIARTEGEVPGAGEPPG